MQVRDEKGRKMSKSIGNVVDPVDAIESNSCDALRLTLATGVHAFCRIYQKAVRHPQ